MDKCAAGAFEKLIKKQTAGGGKTRILPLRGKSGSYGKKNAAQGGPRRRAGPWGWCAGKLKSRPRGGAGHRLQAPAHAGVTCSE